LTTRESEELLQQIAQFGTPAPLVVFTGGDPMWRKDLAELVACGRGLGLTIALTPSGTAAATRDRLKELRDAGITRLAVRLDAADAARHDMFRGVRGSFMWTERIIRDALDLGIPLQIHSTVSAWTLPGLPAMADYVSRLPIELWAVFFLVQTGRGTTLEQISGLECEEALRFLARAASRVPFAIKTTEAPHFRRVLLEAGMRSQSLVSTTATGSRSSITSARFRRAAGSSRGSERGLRFCDCDRRHGASGGTTL
jgi:AdoMet-dependent heme synthase